MWQKWSWGQIGTRWTSPCYSCLLSFFKDFYIPKWIDKTLYEHQHRSFVLQNWPWIKHILPFMKPQTFFSNDANSYMSLLNTGECKFFSGCNFCLNVYRHGIYCGDLGILILCNRPFGYHAQCSCQHCDTMFVHTFYKDRTSM